MKTGFDALGTYCVPLEIAVEGGIFRPDSFLSIYYLFGYIKGIKVVLDDKYTFYCARVI